MLFLVLSQDWGHKWCASPHESRYPPQLSKVGSGGFVVLTNGNSDQFGSGGVTALNNGNYVVSSLLWNNGATADTGAITWGSGATTGSLKVTQSWFPA